MRLNMSKETIKLHIPRWKELPNVDLYLDQVVTLVNETLSSFLSNSSPDEDTPILTKNMINNYVKNKIVESNQFFSPSRPFLVPWCRSCQNFMQFFVQYFPTLSRR